MEERLSKRGQFTPPKAIVVPHAGYQNIAKHSALSYSDFSVTLGKDFGKGLSASLAVVATLLAVGIGLLITRNLLKVLGGEPAYAADVMRKVAVGDFTVDVQVRANDTST